MPELSEFTLYHRTVREVHPEVYQREVKKYAGRESLQQERVLPLDCLWGEVLFLSPVHPKLLLDAVRASGRDVPPLSFWEVNAAALVAERACIKFVKPWPGGVYVPPGAADFAPFTPETLAEVSVPAAESLARLSKLSADSPIMLWLDVPHVLYRGQIPLLALQEVRC